MSRRRSEAGRGGGAPGPGAGASTPRRLRWSGPEGSTSRHVYRDTVLVYAGLAVIVVLVALVTGGGFVRAVVVAGLFFAVACTWSLYRLRRREQAAAGEHDAARGRSAQ